MSVTRRKAIIAGAIGAAFVGVPAARHAAWSLRDFERDNWSEENTARQSDQRTWQNWSGLQRSHPREFFSPGSEDELADFMARARGLIRPVGSGHSFTPLVNSDGAIVDISRLQGLLSHNPEAGTATFAAGTRLRRAAQLSDPLNLAFMNLPDIDTQTLAGGYATATHGTGRDIPAIHADIVGFRLVTPRGEVVDVSAGRDDELLRAGQVSLGALGVITQYTLKLRPSYRLHRRVWVERIDSLLDRAEELARVHRNFEFFYAPHTGYAIALSHDETDQPVGERPGGQDDEFLAGMRDMRDRFGWSSWIRRRIADAAFPKGEIENFVDVSWKLLATSRPVRFNESEYHVPEENGLKAVRETIEKLESRNDTFFPVEVRFVRGDDAWLSPFWHGQDVSIAIHASVDEPCDYLVEDFEPMFRRYGGRPHWGKLHGLGARDFTELYPRMNDFRALQKELDPSGKMLNAHLRQILEVS
ncbi:D-arabinono-1,4-lactone oxidase [Parahaliea mediterranea]|uniref:FAD-binding protein n=1 Tax=Parahaliea mediterranea TaxID=651086 RepID=A0A939IPH1_9GAMM|nr:D-arabinono-1,4-lactone oxidase [Parahaliea mediterranea]MBN7799052.1 FAD-binding protein [Parahaliea mediterranea]